MNDKLPPEVRVKVAEECHPPEHLWHWELRADTPYEVWKGSGVHRKAWNPEYYLEHWQSLNRTAARLINEGGLAVRREQISEEVIRYIDAVHSNDTDALEGIVAELLGFL